MASCSSAKLKTASITYQSVRMAAPKDPALKNDAEIIAVYTISKDGELAVRIKNNTDEIMVIDQTMSFFINVDGSSTSYFDPTVRTSTVTDISSETSGASVNVGAIAGALGIGGPVGQALSGLNVGGSGTSGQSVSNTTFIADQPRVTVGPFGEVVLSKQFSIPIIGVGFSSLSKQIVEVTENAKKATSKFSVCISYSRDGGKEFHKMTSDFFINSIIALPVQSGRNINDVIKNIYKIKTDAVNEPWWILTASSNLKTNSFANGYFIDFK